VTSADWRALVEAYLDGRLSAEAFMRRFIEAWQNSPGAIPHAIAGLQPHVEAFEARVAEEREEGAVNDDELRQAAQRALSNLVEDTPVSPHTFDRTRAREDMRRFEIRVQRLAGVGCLIAFIWVALCVLQINYVIEWIYANAIPSVWLSALIGFFLAFVPVIGNLLAFLGATQEGHWPIWVAALVFFAAPAATLISGWTRWRRHGR
jgi:hypothetical protein